MSKPEHYLLVTWYVESGDNYRNFEPEYTFVTEKKLDDINSLMREHRIKRWVKNPESVTEKTWEYGDASLIQYRNIEVVPIKVVESWGFSRERV